MADSRLKPLWAALALLIGACDEHRDHDPSSVTVKLPPPHQRPAAPAFTFKASSDRQQH